MATIEVRVDDELIELEVGADDLKKYVHEAFDANLQVKAWQKKLAIAKAVIDQMQPTKKEVYETDFGAIIANRISGGSTATVDVTAILENFELTTGEMKRLLATATVSPKPWEKDDTNLGGLVREHTNRKARSGYISVSIGTKYAD